MQLDSNFFPASQVVMRRKPGRRFHDTDAEEIEEDDPREDLDS